MTHTFLKYTAVAALAATALLGCGNAAEQETAAQATPQPASSTAPASHVERPATNDLVAKPTADGAKAFMYHYVDLNNYARQTGDTSAMLEVSDRAQAPAAEAKSIEGIYADGGWVLGGEQNVQNVFITAPTPSKVAEGMEVTALLPSIPTAYTAFTQDGSIAETREWSSTGTIHTAKLIYQDGGWKLTSLEETPDAELPEA